ncbi:MAG: hypothetical protein ABIG43_02980 [Chloroflexota bacterium]
MSNISINGINPLKVTYEYKTESGETHTDNMNTMSVMTARNWKQGQKVEVLFSDSGSMISGLEPVDFPVWTFGFFALVFPLFGLPFLLHSAIGAFRKKKLYVNGQTKKGKLISIAPLNAFFAPFIKGRFEAHFSFENGAGKEQFNKSITSDLVLINEKKKGDEVDLLYLPENVACVVDDTLMAKIKPR